MELTFHKYADIFPLMDDAELAALAADIRDHGQRDPIILHPDGKILEGRSRYRACQQIGLEPKTERYDGDDPLAFVISRNLRRRHLNESQRALVAARLANIEHGGKRHPPDQAANLPVDPGAAKQTLKTDPGTQGAPTAADQEAPVAQSVAAKMLNVSERSVRTAKVVTDQAAKNVIEAVERGEVSVSLAAKAVKTAGKMTQETWSMADMKAAASKERSAHDGKSKGTSASGNGSSAIPPNDVFASKLELLRQFLDSNGITSASLMEDRVEFAWSVLDILGLSVGDLGRCSAGVRPKSSRQPAIPLRPALPLFAEQNASRLDVTIAESQEKQS
jgi:hypothetical protein